MIMGPEAFSNLIILLVVFQIGDKENLRPAIGVNQANNPTTGITNTKAGTKSASNDTQFEAGCKDWERKLLESSENDPVAVWDCYIRWAQQNSVSKPSFLPSLLRRCTSELQRDERYKGDPRFLRIWIKYIDTSDKPLEIFAHLERNGIGCDLALFYTSWSLVLELKKSAFPEALCKLEEGIRRCARPIEQLQNAMKQFEQRMSKRTMDALKNAALQPVESEPKPAILMMIDPKQLKISSTPAVTAVNSESQQKSLEFSKSVVQESPQFLSQTFKQASSAPSGIAMLIIICLFLF
jgi:hypothetical protein